MNRIKLAYYYLFYRFYLFCETPPFVGDSDWKASGFMAVLEIFIFFSGDIYYKFFFNRFSTSEDDKPIFIIAIGTIIIIKYLAFLRNDVWVDYYEMFEKWSHEKNRKGGIIVLCVIGAILIGFSSAMYLVTKANAFKLSGSVLITIWREYAAQG
jgi:small-conductance mechanosensitive channel